MERLAALARKPRRLVLGLLSGTSADAIDCAVCSIEGAGVPRGGCPGATVRLEAFHGSPFDPALRARSLDASRLDARGVAELHAALGDAFADAALRTLVLHGIPEEAVDLVGSHGQTVYHHAGEPPRATLQLGDADRIAERTGFPVVSDFRARDVAAGGEGAPLTPYADLVLFPVAPGAPRRAVVNLGGIANVTVLDPDPSRVVAFDTGPANAPLDRLARAVSGGDASFDAEGRLAAAGRVDETLLAELMRHPFLARKPPKSTGVEAFGDAFVDDLARRRGRADADLLATVTAFVADSIADALRRHVPGGMPAEIVVAGGGSRNATLVARLARATGVRVVSSDERGVPTQAREAMAFALLANDALFGLPTSLPQVTGARRAVTLGKLSLPPARLP